MSRAATRVCLGFWEKEAGREAVLGAGKHSGRNALRTKLQTLGLELSQDQLDDVFKRFKVSWRPSQSQEGPLIRSLDLMRQALHE